MEDSNDMDGIYENIERIQSIESIYYRKNIKTS